MSRPALSPFVSASGLLPTAEAGGLLYGHGSIDSRPHGS